MIPREVCAETLSNLLAPIAPQDAPGPRGRIAV
jgi:hypothetical protein